MVFPFSANVFGLDLFHSLSVELNQKRWAVNIDMNTSVICVKTLHLLHYSIHILLCLRVCVIYIWFFVSFLLLNGFYNERNIFFFIYYIEDVLCGMYCLYLNESVSFVMENIMYRSVFTSVGGCCKTWIMITIPSLGSMLLDLTAYRRSFKSNSKSVAN